MSEQFEKCFKGFVIPPLADTPEGREAIREGYRGAKNHCYLSCIKCMTGECIKANRLCSRCIACHNCGDAVRKREVFEEYDRRYPVEGAMPELKPGMIVETEGEKGSAFYLVVYQRDHDFIAFRLETKEGDLLLGVMRSITSSDSDIRAIYFCNAWKFLSVSEIAGVVGGEGKVLCVWEKPDPVKEMTVDEISKALGYKVKVVGSEKADD